MEPSAFPWDQPAPERTGQPSAWALLPEDFTRLGAPGRSEHVFGQLQHFWLWREGEPRLSREIRAWMADHLDTELPAVAAREASDDGSTKLALALRDGARIEAVHMPREVRSPRVTLCISSQVGCAMGCAFCATGAMGLRRNLGAGEIVGQVLALLRELGPGKPHQITLVFMGMGEPLHNLDNVHRAIRVLNHPLGLNISTRRITVSTSGLVPGIERLSALEPRPWLALSLNASTDTQRSALMPVNRAYGLAELRAALDRWGLAPGEKMLFEYVLMAGVNDAPEDADRLADWLGELRQGHNLNLIPMNAHGDAPFRAPEPARVEAFARRLKERGCFVTFRKSRGRDIKGACGQLAK